MIGHSAGGGFALRVAGSPIQNLFARTVLLAPYLGYDAPSTRPSSGGWARADIPRILGLLALRKLGITCCEALPVLAFAVPPNSEKTLVPTYTDRLMRNFAVRGDFRRDLAAATKPLTIISGADDELMFADKYAEAVRGAEGRRSTSGCSTASTTWVSSPRRRRYPSSPKTSPRAAWRDHSGDAAGRAT